MSPLEDQAKVVSSNEFFEAIGQQAEQVEQTDAETQEDGEDNARVVEEIESLCMNCHDNVSRPKSPIADLSMAKVLL
jgi:zinc finger protein ZPR1